MKKVVAKRVERGMATAEYAVATLAALTLGGVLLKVMMDGRIFELLLKIIQFVFQHVLKMG
ncbi:MAG: DUF4244 domain-containing protein [Propionibacteriaceae bacterium]